MDKADVADVACLEQQNQSPWSITAIVDELKQERGIALVVELDHPQGQCVVGW